MTSLPAFFLIVAAAFASAQVRPTIPVAKPSGPALPSLGAAPGSDFRPILDYMEAGQRSLGLPEAPAELSAAPELDETYQALRDFKKLDEGQRAVLNGRLSEAMNVARDSSVSDTIRREAVVFMGRVAILSLHDLSTHRLASDRIQTLRGTLGPIREASEEAMSAIMDHKFNAMTPESREFVRQALQHSTPRW